MRICSDPKTNPAAQKLTELQHIDLLKNGLGVMDSTAASLCMDNQIPIIVFGITDKGNVLKAVMGEKIGTVVGRDNNG